MDDFIMTYMEHIHCTSFDNRKNRRKHPAFKDKSFDLKKGTIIRRKLMLNVICTTIFYKFWCILCYCRSNSKVYKKTLLFFFN